MRRDTPRESEASGAASARERNGRRSTLGKKLRQIHGTLTLWHTRSRSRRELEWLDDRLLRDAGVDRSEARKPFWRE